MCLLFNNCESSGGFQNINTGATSVNYKLGAFVYIGWGGGVQILLSSFQKQLDSDMVLKL